MSIDDTESKARQIYEAVEQQRLLRQADPCPHIPWEIAPKDIKALYRKVADLCPLEVALKAVQRYCNDRTKKPEV